MNAKNDRFFCFPRARRAGQQRLVRRLGLLRASACSASAACERVSAGQDGLQLGHRVPGRGGVRLVDDDGEPAPDDPLGLALGGGLGGELGDDGELLQGRDDDPRRVALQGVLELLGLLVDPHDRARRVVQPGDGLLQLPVQDLAVGDDDDLVEDRHVVSPVQPGEGVRRPRDGVRLPRPGRVLDEPVDPGAVAHGRLDDRADRVPLVVAREEDAPVLGVDERAEQVQPRVALPHLAHRYAVW